MKFLLLLAASTGLLCAQSFDLKMPDTGPKTGTSAPKAAAPAKTSSPSLTAPSTAKAAPATKAAPAAKASPVVAPAAPKPGMPAVTGKADLSLDQVIAKARAAIGPEAVLSKVNAIEYVGVVDNDKGQRVAALRYVYRKPDFLRREESRADGGYSALIKDDLEAWILSKQPNGPLERGLMPLGNQDFERDLAVDRLNFLKGPDALERSSVALAGVVQWEGRSAWLLNYTYPVGLGKMNLSRVIDAQTGRVLAVLSNDGRTQAVESGTLESGGLKFPLHTFIYQDGRLRAALTYEKVLVNGSYPDTTFTSP